jgi:lysophospholipase L1-like esterase
MSGAIGVPLIGIASNTQELVRARLTRLLAGAEAAQTRNPRYLGTMGSPPTMASSTTVDATLTNTYFAAGSKEGALGLYGGVVSYATVYFDFDGTLTTAGLPDNNFWRVEAMVDADVVGIQLRAASTSWPFRVLVDDQPADATNFTLATTNTLYERKLTFASKALRKIAVEGHLRALIKGFAVGPTGAIHRPPPSLRVWWQGDSYSAGTGATAGWNSHGRVCCDWLGVSDLWSAATGSTGYTVGGTTGVYLARSSLITSAAPDIIVFQGGYNDRNAAAADVTAAALACFQDARARAPSAPIFVFGAWPGTQGTSAVTATETAIEAAVSAFDDPFTRFIACTNDAAGPWLFGTGREGATNGSGNTDFYIATDAVHPNDAGNAFLGRLCADGIRRAAVDMLASI